MNQGLQTSKSQIKKTNVLSQKDIQQVKESLERLKKFVDDITTKYNFQSIQIQNISKQLTLSQIIKISQQRTQNIIQNQKFKQNWTENERSILNWIVENLAKFRNYKHIDTQFDQNDWKFVSSMIPGQRWKNCMFKWLNLHKNNLKQSKWTQKQNQNLKKIIEQQMKLSNTISWNDISKKLYQLNSDINKKFRTSKQCKQHWNLMFTKTTKSSWNIDQDILLFKTLKQNKGNKKWSKLTNLFEGRSQNSIKNRYNLIISKQKKQLNNVQIQQIQLISTYLARCQYQKHNVIIEPDSDQQKNQVKKGK